MDKRIIISIVIAFTIISIILVLVIKKSKEKSKVEQDVEHLVQPYLDQIARYDKQLQQNIYSITEKKSTL